MVGLPRKWPGRPLFYALLLWVFIRQAYTGNLTPERFRQTISLAYMSIGMYRPALAMVVWPRRPVLLLAPLPTFASMMALPDNTGKWALIFWDDAASSALGFCFVRSAWPGSWFLGVMHNGFIDPRRAGCLNGVTLPYQSAAA